MNDMVTYTDPESGLEIRLEFDLTLNSYRYLFSLDGKVTEDLFLPKDETRTWRELSRC